MQQQHQHQHQHQIIKKAEVCQQEYLYMEH